MEKSHEIKGVAGENLRAAVDWLPQGRRLVTIKKDCDLSGYIDGLPAMDNIAYQAIDTPAMLDFYTKFGFKGLVRTLQAKSDEDDAKNGAKAAPKAKKTAASEPGLFDEPAADTAMSA